MVGTDAGGAGGGWRGGNPGVFAVRDIPARGGPVCDADNGIGEGGDGGTVGIAGTVGPEDATDKASDMAVEETGTNHK